MRYCGVPSVVVPGRSPLWCSFRHLSRRWTTSIRIQPPQTKGKTNELTQGALVWKWSDETPNVFAFIPIIPLVNSENGLLEAAPLQASMTFHKITVRIREVASMICVLERTLESPFVLVRRNGAIRFARDEDGSVTIAGHIYPFSEAHVRGEDQKHNFAAVIDPISAIALKHHLESVVRLHFDFDRHISRARRDKHQATVDDYRFSTSRPSFVAQGTQASQEPLGRAAVESTLPPQASAQYASQLEEQELAARASASDRATQNTTPQATAPKLDEEPAATGESETAPPVAELSSKQSKATAGEPVAASRPAKGGKESRKERSRRKKKEEALETQQLFDI